ncbi:Protein of unknown function [Gryllus bimaculatus]|nr:Protein of unknown function [Gryllus bimaculatus]
MRKRNSEGGEVRCRAEGGVAVYVGEREQQRLLRGNKGGSGTWRGVSGGGRVTEKRMAWLVLEWRGGSGRGGSWRVGWSKTGRSLRGEEPGGVLAEGTGSCVAGAGRATYVKQAAVSAVLSKARSLLSPLSLAQPLFYYSSHRCPYPSRRHPRRNHGCLCCSHGFLQSVRISDVALTHYVLLLFTGAQGRQCQKSAPVRESKKLGKRCPTDPFAPHSILQHPTKHSPTSAQLEVGGAGRATWAVAAVGGGPRGGAWRIPLVNFSFRVQYIVRYALVNRCSRYVDKRSIAAALALPRPRAATSSAPNGWRLDYPRALDCTSGDRRIGNIAVDTAVNETVKGQFDEGDICAMASFKDVREMYLLRMCQWAQCPLLFGEPLLRLLCLFLRLIPVLEYASDSTRRSQLVALRITLGMKPYCKTKFNVFGINQCQEARVEKTENEKGLRGYFVITRVNERAAPIANDPSASDTLCSLPARP